MSTITLRCNSLSEIPPVSTLDGFSKFYLTLPVVVLAYQQLKMGVLLVTDFTEIPELGFAHNQLPTSLPDRFLFRDKDLSPSRILAVGVPKYRRDGVWNEIQLYGPQMRNFDYSQTESCNLLKMCVIAILNIKVNVYNGYLEGFYCGLSVLSKTRYDSPESLGNVTTEMFEKFMNRLSNYMDCKLFDRLIHCFPIDKFVSRLSLPDYKSVSPEKKNYLNKSESVEEYPPPSKIRKLQPSDLLYREQATQLRLQVNETIFPLTQIPQTQPQFEINSSIQLSNLECWKRNRINDILFHQFCDLKCFNLEPETCFRIRCSIQEIDPIPENVFVKPYLETLTAAQITLVLGDAPFITSVEITNNEEACAFFGFEEVEEAIANVENVHSALQLLLSKEVTLEVAAKRCTLQLGRIFMYWCPTSTLMSLTDYAPKRQSI